MSTLTASPSGGDCECCGDRWYRAYDEDATDEPLIYDQSPEMYPLEPGDSALIVPLCGDAYRYTIEAKADKKS